MAQSHGSSSFVMPLEGSGKVLVVLFVVGPAHGGPNPRVCGWVATYLTRGGNSFRLKDGRNV